MVLLNGDKPTETNLCASLPDPSINTVETESPTHTLQDILSQMQSLLDKLKLESAGRNTLWCQPHSVTDDCVSNNDIERKVRLCSSLKEIETLFNDIFHYDRINDLLTCICCFSDFSPPLVQNKSGVFSVLNMEYEKLKVRSSRFKNLTANLIAHVNSPSHRKPIKGRRSLKKWLLSLLETSKLVTTSVHFFFYCKLPFILFERFRPWVSLHKIDIGQVNHSEIFLRQILHPCYKELLKHWQNSMRQINTTLHRWASTN